MGLRGVFGNPDDLAGLALSVAIPRDGWSRDEKVLEAFFRWPMTAHTQIPAGAQAIFDPGNLPDSSTVGVFPPVCARHSERVIPSTAGAADLGLVKSRPCGKRSRAEARGFTP